MRHPAIVNTIVTKNSKLQLLSASALILSLIGCSGGGSTNVPADTLGQLLPEANIGSGQPQEDETGSNAMAEPITEITAASGVQIVFANEDQQLSIGGEYVERQWVQMQTCLQITAQTPTVHIIDGNIAPLSSDDDVLRYIDGSVLATSTVTATDVTIQVAEADFDGSVGNKGNVLRSIIGRYLWFSSNLPERDYPYNCANVGSGS